VITEDLRKLLGNTALRPSNLGNFLQQQEIGSYPGPLQKFLMNSSCIRTAGEV
jgi:hypothetical protein